MRRPDFFSGAENEEKSRTAIYTISHDADFSTCFFRTMASSAAELRDGRSNGDGY